MRIEKTNLCFKDHGEKRDMHRSQLRLCMKRKSRQTAEIGTAIFGQTPNFFLIPLNLLQSLTQARGVHNAGDCGMHFEESWVG